MSDDSNSDKVARIVRMDKVVHACGDWLQAKGVHGEDLLNILKALGREVGPMFTAMGVYDNDDLCNWIVERLPKILEKSCLVINVKLPAAGAEMN